MPWQHLVASYDGSPAAATAAFRAESIARDAACRCSVLVFGADVTRAPTSAKLVAMTGIPSIEVPRWAEDNGADVIVLPGGAEHACESAAIIRRSAIPCLLVPAWQRRFTSFHVALDRTERGLQVLGPARSAAASVEADVDYVTVTAEGDESVAAAWLRDRAGVPAPATTVLTGFPVPALAGLMAHSHEGVLVLGVRQGRSGSVPESSGVGRTLLRSAECAFLTVPL
jgi:hypothetical protein